MVRIVVAKRLDEKVPFSSQDNYSYLTVPFKWMSYFKLQYPDLIGGYCDGKGHDHHEQERDKKTAHYPPGAG